MADSEQREDVAIIGGHHMLLESIRTRDKIPINLFSALDDRSLHPESLFG